MEETTQVLSGFVILPNGSDFSVIPKYSCLRITLQGIGNNHATVASLKMTDLEVVDHKISFVMSTENIPPPYILRYEVLIVFKDDFN